MSSLDEWFKTKCPIPSRSAAEHRVKAHRTGSRAVRGLPGGASFASHSHRELQNMMTDSALLENTRIYYGRHVETPIAKLEAEFETHKKRGAATPQQQLEARAMRELSEKAEYERLFNLSRAPERVHPGVSFGRAANYAPVPSSLSSFSAYVPSSGSRSAGGTFGRVDTHVHTAFTTAGLSFHTAYTSALPADYGQTKGLTPADHRRALGGGSPRTNLPSPMPSPRPWL